MPSTAASNPKIPQPLFWLGVAVLMIVGMVLFRGNGPADTVEVGARDGRLAKQSEIPDAGRGPAQNGPPEITSAVGSRRVAHSGRGNRCSCSRKRSTSTAKTFPLEVAITDLGRQLGVPVWFDRMTLGDERVAMDQPVSIHLHGISGRAVLALMLEPVQLTWVIEDEVLKVTTTAKAAEKLDVRVYDVTDLVIARDPRAPGLFSFNSLTTVIQQCVKPASWGDLSGPGSITPVTLPGQSRTLAIRQTQAVHNEVSKLLADLRKARHAEGDDRVRPIVVSADESPAARREAAIRQALGRPVSVKVQDAELGEVIRDITRQAGIPLFIDRATLADEGVSPELPVTLDCPEIAARSALRLILEPAQLAWIVRHEVLFVTTSAKAGEFEEARVYDMTDIAPRYRNEAGYIQLNLQSIIRAIPQTIQPDSWQDGGSVLPAFRSSGVLALVIPQTQAIHEEIAAFLAQLRELQQTRATAKPPENPAEVRNPFPVPGPRYWFMLDSRRDALAHGNNRFALELYSKIARRTTDNLIVSPYYISRAVAQAYTGARGETAREIDGTMHFSLRQKDVPFGFRTLNISSFLQGPDGQVTPSCRLWTQPGVELLETFLKTLNDDYDTQTAAVDFSDPAESAQAINDWSVAHTNGSILRVANPASFGETNRFVVTTALRFHGKWSRLFNRDATTLDKFSNLAGELEVAMMHLKTDRSRYAVVDGVEVLDKTYGNSGSIIRRAAAATRPVGHSRPRIVAHRVEPLEMADGGRFEARRGSSAAVQT